MNGYADILKRNTGRLLNLYDRDPSSPTKGLGDREAWGWKVKDFHNATMQGGVHALAIGLVLGIHEHEQRILDLIDDVILATPKTMTSKGSLQEAYPSEHSFCVTAIVAFDILSAIHRLGDRINAAKKTAYLAVVRPLIGFITKHGEAHAIISNHLATGVAAVSLWNHLSGERSKRHEELLDIILKHQSPEGWHKEYEGADPGYQTLCLYYLSAAAEVWPDKKLKESMAKALEFLRYFAHPDRTIGGLYGSRNTEVYYPGGLVFMAGQEGASAELADCFFKGIEEQKHLLPEQIDSGNYIPLLNAYAFAAVHAEKSMERTNETALPFETIFEKDFPDAGIFIKSTASYYLILNYKKGGTIKVFDKRIGKLDIEDGGVFGVLRSGKRFSTQNFQRDAQWNDHRLQVDFFRVNEGTPSSFTTIILRLLSLTIFRSVALGNLFKKQVVSKLMTANKKVGGHSIRSFEFQEDKVIITEQNTAPQGCTRIGRGGKSKAIHMASSGYFLPQQFEAPPQSAIVTFR